MFTSTVCGASSEALQDPDSPQAAGSEAPSASQPAALPAGCDHTESLLRIQSGGSRAAGGSRRPSDALSPSVKSHRDEDDDG